MQQEASAWFVRLLMQHQNALLRYILPLVGHLEDAQDVLQEAAAAMWRKIDAYDRAQPFLPWARQFARNEVLMHHRRRKRFTFLSEELIDSLAASADRGDAESRRLRRREALDSCLSGLDERDRALIRSRYVDRDMTIQRLASETGASENVLYKSLGRIRRRLLECVARKLATES